MKLRRVLTIVLVVSFACSPFAPSSGRVTGTIRLEGRTSTIGVVVGINALGLSTETAEDGSFSLAPVPYGEEVAVRTSASGFESATNRVTLDEPGFFACDATVGDVGEITLPATQPLVIPVISELSVADITSSSARILWTTDVPADSSVRYGIFGAATESAGLTPRVTDHAVPLSVLFPGLPYTIQARSVHATGGSAVPANGSFSTLPPSGGTFMRFDVAIDASSIEAEKYFLVYWVQDAGGFLSTALVTCRAAAAGKYTNAQALPTWRSRSAGDIVDAVTSASVSSSFSPPSIYMDASAVSPGTPLTYWVELAEDCYVSGTAIDFASARKDGFTGSITCTAGQSSATKNGYVRTGGSTPYATTMFPAVRISVTNM
jgi:hypothetical protein